MDPHPLAVIAFSVILVSLAAFGILYVFFEHFGHR